jgi:hypothetical protein
MNTIVEHFRAWRDSISEDEFLEIWESNPHIEAMIGALIDLADDGPDPDEA